ncbi:phosphatase PAP2 family protein [Candidatus Saccharibacteria bacterium]|nr:phosphatase PAP2 family protein [Candidatus Saccharibacteria bacterium]
MIERVINELRQLVHTLSRAMWQRVALYFAVYLLPVVGFVALADEVREQDTLGFDDAVLRYIHEFASATNDAIVIAITDFGYVWWVSAAAIALLVILWRARRYRDMAVVALGIGGSAVINVILKALFQRDRPQLWERIVTENSYSFPSGHAMASASLAVVIMVILWPTRWRWWAIAGGVVYMVVIGLTRLYLSVHYPTDIMAGWLVAAVWVLAVAAIVYRKQRHEP